MRWLSELASAQNARERNGAAAPALNFFSPVRLIIACAVALALIVVASAGLIAYNLRIRVLSENAQALSNSALIVAKQIEQAFAAVQAVERRFNDDLPDLPVINGDTIEREYKRHATHIKLRDKAGGMPFVGSLAIFNAKGQLINSSHRWPIPDVNVANEDYFTALETGSGSGPFLGRPVRDNETGSWVIHLAHRISGPKGEFLGVISAAIDLHYLQNYFRDISPNPDSSFALFRSDGMLMARHPEQDADIGRQFPNALALKLVADSNHGVGSMNGVIDSIPRMIAGHRVGGYPIVVSATRATSFVLAHWRRTAIYIAGAAVLALAVIAAFALLFTRLFRNYQALEQARAERNRAEQLREQSLRFDVALNNMSQGLVMFDANSRLVVVNTRFLEIYGLSPDVIKPGITLLELLRHRKECGSFAGNPEEYNDVILQRIAARKLTKRNVPTPSGRIIQIVNQPMPDGGWVATHEDITEKIEAETAIKKQKEQLDAALAHISQGVCMFDASKRLIICNKQYADIYELTEELTKPGTPFQAIIEYTVARGNGPKDSAAFLKKRLNDVAGRVPYQTTNQLRDGRYVAVVHRPMANGGWVATHQDVTEAKHREESFRLLFEGNPAPMWVIDRDTFRFLAVNEAAVAHYGFTREQFMAMSVADLRPPEDRDRFRTFIQSLSDDQFVENVGEHITADGRKINVAVYSRALTYNGHNARLTVIHDVTKTKLTEAELRRTKIFLDAVIEHVPLPIIVRHVDGAGANAQGGRFLLFNRAYEELTGDARDRLIGKTAHELFPPERADIIVKSDLETLQTNGIVATPEHYISTADHGLRLIKASKIAIRDDSGDPQYLLTVLDDITERRRSEQHISYLAHNDSLTGLPNRTSFLKHLFETLDDAARNNGRFAIMCLDLDRFKEANDTYGHLVGDGLLREAARRLQTAAEGAFLARIGGDEFIVVLASDEPEVTAGIIGERMIEAFKKNFEVDGHQLQVGLSVGVAIYPADGADATALIANADAALYQAKAEVRGSVRFFEEKLGSRLRERRELQTDLRAAPDRGDIHLHYQPQKTITHGEVVGFEALARWHCPKRGWVSPETFIPIAEQSTYIITLGEWILREACREAASWPNPLKVAVNISPVQFHHGDLPKLIHSILLETGLKPDRLELEITEGVLIDDFSRAVSILRKLKLLGVHIALDDFGSGYSSLSYLHAFPFEKIKIDRVFVGDLENNHHSMAIVRAIITLGHSLNIPVLAEGVENNNQLSFLAQEGCDEVQGYLTGKPQPIQAYAELVGHAVAKPRHKAAAG
ncbi:MAG TPA: PAS-domain containing protein [Pseudolabrys sp.]|nr:PAS-domain containing protein [Pseudolabrys sp.]